jgi:uncharacterized membrane protein (UPF0127 family)
LLHSKYLRLASVCVIFVVLILLILVDSHKSKTNSACGVYRKDEVVTISHQTLNAEVAASPSQHEKGLSGRPCILAGQAMLFVFDKNDQYLMWMKGMKFPVDIIWVSADHKAVGVERDVKPSTYPDKFANKKENPAKYVLEMKANSSTELGITLGTPISF